MIFSTPHRKRTVLCRKNPSYWGRATLFLRQLLTTSIIVTILFSCPISIRSASAEQAAPVSHHQLTAVYLYNFLYFTTWPDTPTDQVKTPFTIGIIGRSPVREALQSMEASLQSSKKKNIRLVYYDRYVQGLDFTDCQILFISSSEKDHYPEIIQDLKNAPILSVAEEEGFLTAGGMITIREYQNKLRYKINRKAASKAGLRLSSQLLKSALSF